MNQGRPAEGKEVPAITQLNFVAEIKFYFRNSNNCPERKRWVITTC